MAKEKIENVELDIKEPDSTNENKKELENFNELLKSNDKKLSSLEKEIKSVVDKIDSFEFDTDAELTKKEPEPEEKKSKSGLFIMLAILGILVAWTFKDKLTNGIQQKKEAN